MTPAERAERLLALHHAPELLVLVNVWDAASARVVAAQPGCTALATASHAVAAAHGYADGEAIPLELVVAVIERVVAAAGELPVTADLEAGYGDTYATVRAVEEAVAAGERAGIPFVLNARTDAVLRGADKDPAAVLAVAIERGRAYLDAGASTFLVPGRLDQPAVEALVEALGPQKVNVIGAPGSLPLETLQRLGVARVSYGPWSQNVALTALATLAEDVYAGGGLPEGTRKLN